MNDLNKALEELKFALLDCKLAQEELNESLKSTITGVENIITKL